MKSKLTIFSFLLILSIGLMTFIIKKNTVKELNFYTHNDKVIDEIIENFEKENKNIKINKIPIPDHEDRLEFILKALNDDDGNVDIIDADIIWIYNLAKNKHIIPLDNYFSNKSLTRFLSSSINGNIIDSKIFAIPYRTDTGIFYYRKDLLNKYNQKVPTTFDEMLKTYKIISKHENIYGYAGSWENYEGLTCNGLELLWSFGGNLNLDGSKNIINTKKNEIAFKKMKNLIDTKFTHPNILNFYSGDLRDEFIKGNILFMRDWPTGWNAIQNEPNSKVKDKVEISTLPLGAASGSNNGALGGWQLSVANKSQYKDESVEFIKFFINHKNNKELILEKSYVPTKKVLFYDSDVIKNIPFIKKNIHIFNNARHRPFIKEYNQFSSIFSSYLTRYLKNEITLDTFLSEIEEKLKKLLSEN